jgi:hypothetical protein
VNLFLLFSFKHLVISQEMKREEEEKEKEGE